MRTAPNRTFFGVQWGLQKFFGMVTPPYPTILLIHKIIKPKISLIAKHNLTIKKGQLAASDDFVALIPAPAESL